MAIIIIAGDRGVFVFFSKFPNFVSLFFDSSNSFNEWINNEKRGREKDGKRERSERMME